MSSNNVGLAFLFNLCLLVSLSVPLSQRGMGREGFNRLRLEFGKHGGVVALTWLLASLPVVEAKMNLRGKGSPDNPNCWIPCDMGGCEFVGCNSARVSCGGGGCNIISSTEARCEGGGCTFSGCVDPSCGGGGCTFWNSEGGDAPKVVKETRIKRQKTLGQMDPEEIAVRAGVGGSGGGGGAEGGRETERDLPKGSITDTGAANGFLIEDPNIHARNYDREGADTVKTGQGGVLDASWTVGGRVEGREDVERMKQIEDLDAWARDVKKRAEEEVAKARREKLEADATSEEVARAANKAVEEAMKERERQEHEAMKSAELARQWKDYSEKVEAQARGRAEEIDVAKEEAGELREELERGDIAAASHLLVTLSSSFVLSYYLVFYVHAGPSFGPSGGFSFPAARLFLHLFFMIFSFINALVTSIIPTVGAALLCAPVRAPPAAALCLLELLYALGAAVGLARERRKYGWFARLYQLAAIVVLLDFKVQARKHCPMYEARFLTCAMPFIVGSVLYGVCVALEAAIFRSLEEVKGDGDGALDERDKKLGELLFDFFKTDGEAWREGKKNEEGLGVGVEMGVGVGGEEEKKEAGGGIWAGGDGGEGASVKKRGGRRQQV
ncbi:hypothetical protein TrRE_jg4225 [Triparma retinervis]|uniref:Uncharacterized protein n=1 Tax=Triparma retinervis TaxID=2557542 RepID=A0A9W7E585_9STRA|nr:hypothetical protein TrRE_jg4225 [Triparma retinervis]